MGVDLRLPKRRFATLIEDIPDTVISQFIVWLDEKVSEFKVNGAMSLELSDAAPKWIQNYSMSIMLSGASSPHDVSSTENSPGRYTSLADRHQTATRTSLKARHHTDDGNNNSRPPSTISSLKSCQSRVSKLSTNSSPVYAKRQHTLPYDNSQSSMNRYFTRLNLLDNEHRKNRKRLLSSSSDSWAKQNPVISRINSSIVSDNFNVRKSPSSTSDIDTPVDAAVLDSHNIKTEPSDNRESSGRFRATTEKNCDNSVGNRLSAETELRLDNRIGDLVSSSISTEHNSPNFKRAVSSNNSTTSDDEERVLKNSSALCIVNSGVVTDDFPLIPNLSHSESASVRIDSDTPLSSIQNQTSLQMSIDEDTLSQTDISQESIVLSYSGSEWGDIQDYESDLVPNASNASTDRGLMADDSQTYGPQLLDVWNSGITNTQFRRGRQLSEIWNTNIVLLPSPDTHQVPTQGQISFLSQCGLGIPLHEQEVAAAIATASGDRRKAYSKISRHWSIAELEGFIIDSYPKFPLREIGFVFAKANKKKNLMSFYPSSISQLEHHLVRVLVPSSLFTRRGRQMKQMWSTNIVLLPSPSTHHVPSPAEINTLSHCGLGVSLHEQAGSFVTETGAYKKPHSKINREWSIEELREFIISIYPTVPLREVGFTFAKANNVRRLFPFYPNSISEIEQHLVRGKLFIRPASALCLDREKSACYDSALMEQPTYEDS